METDKGSLDQYSYGSFYNGQHSQGTHSSPFPSVAALYPEPRDHPPSYEDSSRNYGINRNAPVRNNEQLEIEARKINIPEKITTILHQLREFHLLFIIDDSHSMQMVDTKLSFTRDGSKELTRMQELQMRFKELVPLLAVLSDRGLTIKTLNDTTSAYINGDDSEDIKKEKMIRAIDSVKFGYETPLIRVLEHSFLASVNAQIKTMAYVMTDGEPSDKFAHQSASEAISGLFRSFRDRADGGFFPINLMPCTGNDADVGWMNKIDKDIKCVQVTDDYFSEAKEVYNAHGSFVNYTYGLYMAVSLAAPINNLLDHLDENKNFLTVGQLETLNGSLITSLEYEKYKKEANEARNKAGRYDYAAGELHPVNEAKTVELNGTTLFRVGVIEDNSIILNNDDIQESVAEYGCSIV